MSNLAPANWGASLTRLRDDLTETLDRWISRFRRDGGDTEAFWSSSLFASGGPIVDLEEDEDEVRVAAELPGLNKDEFQVHLDNNRLTISGEKKASREKKNGSQIYSERSYGSFSRSISLPCEVDSKNIKADYKNGLLHIRLRKTEEAKSKKIPVAIQS